MLKADQPNEGELSVSAQADSEPSYEESKGLAVNEQYSNSSQQTRLPKSRSHNQQEPDYSSTKDAFALVKQSTIRRNPTKQHKAACPQPQEDFEEQKEDEAKIKYIPREDRVERLNHLEECAFELIDEKTSELQN